MQIRYLPKAEERKTLLLSQYKGIIAYFNKIELMIETNPHSPVHEEILLFNGKIITCFKRQVRTDLFSGLIPDPYLYLSISYFIIDDSTIGIIGVYLHNYTP
jgi:hypothetical protein